jgi:actin-related protein
MDDIEPDIYGEYTVIIDIGQALSKVGFAGEENPRAIFPTVIGKPKYNTMVGVKTQSLYVGDDTVRMRGVLKLSYPISRGIVMDWDNYFAILNHIFFNVLRIESKKCNVLYLVPPLTPSETSQYFARVLLETHQVRRVAIIDSATTAVFSVGETTGLSIELGAGITTITPVMNGQIYNPSIRRLNLAGIDIEEHLGKLLTSYGIFQKREILRDIKEKSIRISMKPDKDSQDSANNVDFIMPDGEKLKIGSQISIMAAEILFNPILFTMGIDSLPYAIISSLKAVDPYYWRILLGKIILTGGTSYLKGLEPRLKMEIENLLPQLGPLPDIPEGNTPETPTSTPLVKEKVMRMNNCSKCGELVDFNESDFCPSCGEKLEIDQIAIIDVNSDTISRKDKKLLKKTAMGEAEFLAIASDVEDEYGTVEDNEELSKITLPPPEKKAPKDPIVDILLTKHRIYSAYKGAAILGAVPSFRQYMVDLEKFTTNPDAVIVDFQKIINL